jgi:hypothetical protein
MCVCHQEHVCVWVREICGNCHLKIGVLFVGCFNIITTVADRRKCHRNEEKDRVLL